MSIISSILHQLPEGAKQKNIGYFFRVFREHIALVGAGAVAVLLLGALLFDGLVFYRYVVRQREPAAGDEKKITISENDVKDIIILLDNRQKEFEGILKGFTEAKNATSSAKIQ